MKTVTKDGYVVPSDAARAVGRFDSDGVKGYRAANIENAPLRATRAEAVQDWIAAHDAAVTPAPIAGPGEK